MALLIVGLIIFLGTHLTPTRVAFRQRLIKKLGEGAYKAFFSLITLVGLAFIVTGKYDAEIITLFNPPAWAYKLVPIAMLPALILFAAAFLPGNIKRITRNPMLLAVKLWALSHIIANGDLASLLIFVSFLAFAVYDMISVKKRGQVIRVQTGKPALLWDLAAVATGLILFGFAIWAHSAWFNVVAWHY